MYIHIYVSNITFKIHLYLFINNYSNNKVACKVMN